MWFACQGNLMHFINGIDTILNHLTKSNIEIIKCGDIKMNYLVDSCSKWQLDNLLINVINTVRFPTRSTNWTISAIGNMFVDISHISKCAICSFINGLSDHDSQVIKLENMLTQNKLSETKIMRNFNKYSVDDFKIKLSHETWDNGFNKHDVNKMFNNFHNTCLGIFIGVL